MDDYKPISEVLESLGQLTDSPPPCAKLEIQALMAIPMSDMTPEQCAKLKELATSHIERITPATPEQLARHLEFIAATLPSRNIDVESGQRRFAVYFRLLGGYPNEALAYMTERACREQQWFPTPATCLEILAGYNPPATISDNALDRCAYFAQMQFEAFKSRLLEGVLPQGEIDDKPEQWLRVLVEQGPLRRMDDGTFIQRQPA